MVGTHKNTSQLITPDKLLEHIGSLTRLIGNEADIVRFPTYDSSIGVAEIKTFAKLNQFNIIGFGSGNERIELVFSDVKVASVNKPAHLLCADKDVFVSSEDAELKIQLSAIELQTLLNSGTVDTRQSSLLKMTGDIIRFDRDALDPLSLLSYPPQN